MVDNYSNNETSRVVESSQLVVSDELHSKLCLHVTPPHLLCPLRAACKLTWATPFLICPFPSPPIFPSRTPSLSHTQSSCGAPMVTCEPRKQDKLSAYKSQQCACPLSLAHPAWQQKHQQRLPPPAHSNVKHLVWSRGLLCKSTVFLTSPASYLLSTSTKSG